MTAATGMEAATSGVSTDELGQVLHDYMDVTRRLQHTHEALQREVIRLRDELAVKNRELEVGRRLAALGELAAGLAHEVRNPLGAIQLYSGLLKKKCAQLEPAIGLIEKIELGIQAIDAVVRDALALAPRSRRGALHLLSETVAAARDNCQQKLQQHGVQLTVRLTQSDVCVRAEPDGLQRVLVNLISNAAEASPAGGRIDLLAGPNRAGSVEIRVCDHGPGLSEEALERLFDPFFTTKQHGTGLGLTIAHRLIESYGGSITARNRAEGGAEFRLVLPAAEQESEQTSTDPARQTTAA